MASGVNPYAIPLAPLANPLYFSDSPRFLQRQRARAACAAVSEHVPSWTCACQKCKLAAETRAVPGYGIGPAAGIEAPALSRDCTLLPAGFDLGGRAISSSAPPPLSPKSASGLARRPIERRDYMWLLNVLQECCPAADPNAPKVEVARKPFGESACDIARKLHAESLVGKFGFKIPDTVILRNGKPKKRFSLDSTGRIKAEAMENTSLDRSVQRKLRPEDVLNSAGELPSNWCRNAEQLAQKNRPADLLRVLRKYVEIAQKHHPRAPMPIETFRSSSPRKTVGRIEELQAIQRKMQASRSAPTLRNAGEGRAAGGHSLGGGFGGNTRNSILERRESNRRRKDPEKFREAAVLYYGDGAVRYMTTQEALKQMYNVSRLPKEFWQHIVMLQMPVTVYTSFCEADTRHITYSYDASASSEGVMPQAPLPLVKKRSHASHVDSSGGKEGGIVAGVLRKIKDALSNKTKGRYGNGARIISGRFEFVLDESDGALFLINAEKLIIEQHRVMVEDSNSKEDDHIRYFEEDDFREFMQEQESTFDALKQRWELQEPPCLGLTSEEDRHSFILVSRNASDRLSGVKCPEELVKYHKAGREMDRYYNKLVEDLREEENNLKTGGNRALGLCIWFKRWVRVHQGRRRPAMSKSARQQPSPQSCGGSGARARSAGHIRQAS